MPDIFGLIAGPLGGMVAMGFGAGFVAGYSFAQKTIIIEAKSRITLLEKRLEEVQREVKDLLREGRSTK